MDSGEGIKYSDFLAYALFEIDGALQRSVSSAQTEEGEWGVTLS